LVLRVLGSVRAARIAKVAFLAAERNSRPPT
jgi:hypothetical protein